MVDHKQIEFPLCKGIISQLLYYISISISIQISFVCAPHKRVIRGIGELDMHQREKQARKFAHAERNLTRIQQDLDLPYLLLDIRDRDEYDQCHIITALNYPTAMLSRSMNNESPELLAYKNQPGKIIVVYDDDEKIGNRAATTLVQRGYDNLFLLSGGKWPYSFY